MGKARLVGPDGLAVQAVEADGTYGVWARWQGITDNAVLLVTRRGALAGLYPDVDALAKDIPLENLTPG